MADPCAFSYEKLPSEIRLHILKYTDLVTPANKVYWGPKKRYHVKWSWCSGSGSGSCRPPYDGCHPNSHAACKRPGDGSGVGCPCIHEHRPCKDCSHYSCQFRGTWQPPRGLFLVGRAFYAEVQAVFFSQNVFVLHNDAKCWCWHPYVRAGPGYPHVPPLDRLVLSEFLSQRLATDSLGHVRFIEGCWDGQQGCSRHLDSRHSDARVWIQAVRKDWEATVDAVSDKLNLSVLTVSYWLHDPPPLKAWRAMSPNESFKVAEPVKRHLVRGLANGCVRQLEVDLGTGELEIFYFLRRRDSLFVVPPARMDRHTGRAFHPDTRDCKPESVRFCRDLQRVGGEAGDSVDSEFIEELFIATRCWELDQEPPVFTISHEV